MDDAALYAALTPLFRNVFKRSVELRPDLTARQVPGWDSFRQVELIVAIEAQFGVAFHIREINAMQTVGDLVRMLAGKLSAESGNR